MPETTNLCSCNSSSMIMKSATSLVKDMLLADTLSRAYIDYHVPTPTEVELDHNHATQFLPIPDH